MGRRQTASDLVTTLIDAVRCAHHILPSAVPPRYRERMNPEPCYVILNGQRLEIPPTTTIAQLLVLAGHGERRVAIECNGEIVPRSQHATHQLKVGDRVEIVQAIGGG